jgi:hypothetical protein
MYKIYIYSTQDGKTTENTARRENLPRIMQVLSAGLGPGDWFKIERVS